MAGEGKKGKGGEIVQVWVLCGKELKTSAKNMTYHLMTYQSLIILSLSFV
jgi:hypothetical protein